MYIDLNDLFPSNKDTRKNKHKFRNLKFLNVVSAYLVYISTKMLFYVPISLFNEPKIKIIHLYTIDESNN